jgi:hypothetical protein
MTVTGPGLLTPVRTKWRRVTNAENGSKDTGKASTAASGTNTNGTTSVTATGTGIATTITTVSDYLVNSR